VGGDLDGPYLSRSLDCLDFPYAHLVSVWRGRAADLLDYNLDSLDVLRALWAAILPWTVSVRHDHSARFVLDLEIDVPTMQAKTPETMLLVSWVVSVFLMVHFRFSHPPPVGSPVDPGMSPNSDQFLAGADLALDLDVEARLLVYAEHPNLDHDRVLWVHRLSALVVPLLQPPLHFLPLSISKLTNCVHLPRRPTPYACLPTVGLVDWDLRAVLPDGEEVCGYRQSVSLCYSTLPSFFPRLHFLYHLPCPLGYL
jgi:hypothetical protein